MNPLDGHELARRAATVTQLAYMYGVSRDKIIREIKRGNLVGRQLGRKFIIELADAETWFKSFPPRVDRSQNDENSH